MSTLPIQIQTGYRADWHDFLLRAETDAGCWTAEVADRNQGGALYTARRSSLRAAQLAAVEFAMFRETGPSAWDHAEQVAGHLPWKAYWQR